MFAGHFCQSEVCSGGFEQLFWNPTGVLAPEAVEGFREIGLPQLAALIESAIDLLGPPYPRVIRMNESLACRRSRKVLSMLLTRPFLLSSSQRREALKLRPNRYVERMGQRHKASWRDSTAVSRRLHSKLRCRVHE